MRQPKPQIRNSEADEVASGEKPKSALGERRLVPSRKLGAAPSDRERRIPILGDAEEREDGEGGEDGEDGENNVNADQHDARDESSSVLGPGHNVMDRAALSAALDAVGYNGSFDHLSGGEEQRARLLLHYRDRTPLFRPHVVGSPAMLARLQRLDAASPNFAEVSRLVLRAAYLSFVSGRPLRVPPVMMLGAPGVGKTRYAKALAEALDTSLEVVTGSTIPDVGSLTGYPPVWRGASPGRIAKALVAARTSGPLVFVDECEKIADPGAGAFPLDRLLTVLEPHSAATYEDEHLRVPLRAQHVSWMFAANSLDGLSAPLRDRVVVVDIPGLSPDQRDGVLETMLAEVAQDVGLPMSLASRNVLEPLRSLGLRRARLAFEIAIPRAIERGRRFLIVEDLHDTVTLLGAAETRQPMGFVRHRSPSAD